MAASEREYLNTHLETGEKAPHVPSRSIPNAVNVGDADRWASAVSGGALVAYGLLQRSMPGYALASAGTYLVYRAVSGYCVAYNVFSINTAKQGEQGIRVEKSITINASPAELYTFWRNFENLPQFMNHLESVTIRDDRRSRWVAKAPAGSTVEWDAEITEERENKYIAWRSLPNADVENIGSVRFEDAGNGRGTIVNVSIAYNPPAGMVGAIVAMLFGEEPNQQISEDLQRFKRLMETGEIATTEGQPSGTRSALGRILSPNN